MNISVPTYNPTEIERKWQEKWEADGLYHADIDYSRPKHYALTMLPYPSGDLHIGHWYAMTPSDARARFMRMQGYNVLFPMGFDAFAYRQRTRQSNTTFTPRSGLTATSNGCASSSRAWGRCLIGGVKPSVGS